MFRYATICFVTSGLLFASRHCADAQTAFVSGLYQIVSGSFGECCGIAGTVVSSLPRDDQSYVKLTVDPQTTLATMTFLGKDTKTAFSVAGCPPGDPVQFSFGFGFVWTDQIEFHVDPGPPPNSEYWSLVVSNSEGGLRIGGRVGLAAPLCADVPTQFTYSNVVAVLLPTPEIRISEVEICWNSFSNTTYQVQYRPALTTNDWVNLGQPILGTGTTNCITDKVLRGQTQRLYRVVLVP